MAVACYVGIDVLPYHIYIYMAGKYIKADVTRVYIYIYIVKMCYANYIIFLYYSIRNTHQSLINQYGLESNFTQTREICIRLHQVYLFAVPIDAFIMNCWEQ